MSPQNPNENTPKSIKYFTIMGERCSGTNYLEQLMLLNFDIEPTYEFGHKHFFGFRTYGENPKEDETLFIGIVRNPYNWLYSFFCNPHHLPEKRQKSINSFLFDRFYSLEDDGLTVKGTDLNYLTKKKYKNIFQMRKLKNSYLMKTMPQKVKHYILINYEEIEKNPTKKLTEIQQKFGLISKNPNTPYLKVKYYKNVKDIPYTKRKMGFSKDILKLIEQNLDKKQEMKLGYWV